MKLLTTSVLAALALSPMWASNLSAQNYPSTGFSQSIEGIRATTQAPPAVDNGNRAPIVGPIAVPQVNHRVPSKLPRSDAGRAMMGHSPRSQTPALPVALQAPDTLPPPHAKIPAPSARHASGVWWQARQLAALQRNSNTVPATLDHMMLRTLTHSAQVKVVSDLPLIRRTAITESDAAFDWRAYMETRWNDISEPVGSTLTTVGSNRFRDHQWQFEAGFRKLNTAGGEFQLGQQYGWQDTNSSFFSPRDQGTAVLALNYTHPLLRGAGCAYNTSTIVLAQLDTKVASAETTRQLQDHLLKVTQAYWSLYLERASLLQKRRLHQRAEEILAELEARQGLDAARSQVIRVHAEVSRRGAELVRAEAAVKNAQDRIQSLVNDPEFAAVPQLEIIPMATPMVHEYPTSRDRAVSTAFQNRPEIRQETDRIKSAAVRLDMSENELLPVLDVVLETYASGLEPNSSIGGAWSNQFNEGEPSYSVGLLFEIPINNRAACSRYKRRQLEARQLQSQFEATVRTITLEAEVAVNELKTAYGELGAKYEAMAAANVRLDHLQNRWRRLPGSDNTVSLMLEDVLEAQKRLEAAEFEFVTAQVAYNLSIVNLKRVTGELLKHEMISASEWCQDGLPHTQWHKAQSMEIAPTAPIPAQPTFAPSQPSVGARHSFNQIR